MTDRPPPAPPSESPLQERLRILRESTGSATLTPNAETYVKRAAELVHNEEGPVGQRHTIAGARGSAALRQWRGGGASRRRRRGGWRAQRRAAGEREAAIDADARDAF